MEPFLAEIRIFGFNFAPRGWALCDGQILPINQNQSLFSILGTTYGGDGRTSFALPDLRGRTAFHVGSEMQQGQKGGEERHFLNINEVPSHDHRVLASSDPADTPVSGGNVLAAANNVYAAPGDATTQVGLASFIGGTGAGQGHENMSPFQVVNFCIALQGLFPSPN